MRKYRITVDERYRWITVDERERWSRPDQWYEYYDTREEAQRRINEIEKAQRQIDEKRKRYGGHQVEPDYYCSVYGLILVERTITVDKIIKE